MFAADDRPTAHPVALSQEDQLKKATRDAEARQATLQAEKDALEQELAKERAKVDELRQKQQTSAILAAMPAAVSDMIATSPVPAAMPTVGLPPDFDGSWQW